MWNPEDYPDPFDRLAALECAYMELWARCQHLEQENQQCNELLLAISQSLKICAQGFQRANRRLNSLENAAKNTRIER